MKGYEEMTTRELELAISRLSERLEDLERRGSGLTETLYSVQQVADMFGVTKEAIYKRISRGEIPAIKLGRLHIRAVDLEKILGKAV